MAKAVKRAAPAAGGELAVVYRPLDDVQRAPRNARTHSSSQLEEIAASMREFGWTNPVLVDENLMLIAGHGRMEAARLVGLVQVPTIQLLGLSDAQKRALAIADNKLALNAGWDEDTLRLEIEALRGMDFDVGVMGFDVSDLADLFAIKGRGLTDPDEAPPLAAEVISAAGEVWLLGEHRLLCGDSTVKGTVELVLAGEAPNLMVTDPPYGVDYDADWRNRAARTSVGMGNRAIGAGAVGKVSNDHRADWREAWALFRGNVCYVWHAGTQVGIVAASLEACKLQMRAQIVWVKPRLVIGRGDYHHQHEPAYYGVRDPAHENWNFVPEHEVAAYAVRKGKPGKYVGGRKQSTIWNIEHIKSETGHSTQKPVMCMQRPIENNSRPGDAIYEPFSGSGTTIIAGEITGRRVLAIELNPAYVDVTIRRWQSFSGGQARREHDGRFFDEVASQAGSRKAKPPVRSGATEAGAGAGISGGKGPGGAGQGARRRVPRGKGSADPATPADA